MGATGWWAEILSFSVATSAQKLRAALVGSRNNPEGAAGIELQQPTASLTGVMPAAGSAAAALQLPAFAAATAIEATIETELQQSVAALTGAGAQVGAGAMSLQGPVAALTGTQAQSGSMAASMRKATTSLTGTHVAPDIEYIVSASSQTGTVTMPAGILFGDFMWGIAVNSASSSVPASPGGWTVVDSGTHSGGSSGYVIAAKLAVGGETSISGWGGGGQAIAVYRNVSATVTVGMKSTATSSTITYPAVTREVTDGTSWIVRFAAVDANVTNLTSNTPAGYTHRAGTTSRCKICDSNGPVASDPVAQTQSMSSSSHWWGITIEMLQA
jgi:hypothetical protein